MCIAQYVAQNARIMLCRFYAQNAPKNAGILCVSLLLRYGHMIDYGPLDPLVSARHLYTTCIPPAYHLYSTCIPPVRDHSLVYDLCPQGVDGAVGYGGPPGPQGAPGLQGSRGRSGKKGLAGTNGIPGEFGPKGTSGPIGIPGLAGAPGKDGFDGQKGERGAQGVGGARGQQGTKVPSDWSISAYAFQLSFAPNFIACILGHYNCWASVSEPHTCEFNAAFSLLLHVISSTVHHMSSLKLRSIFRYFIHGRAWMAAPWASACYQS